MDFGKTIIFSEIFFEKEEEKNIFKERYETRFDYALKGVNSAIRPMWPSIDRGTNPKRGWVARMLVARHGYLL
jgi:hypothetical protein